jgi:hypothetical protein
MCVIGHVTINPVTASPARQQVEFLEQALQPLDKCGNSFPAFPIILYTKHLIGKLLCERSQLLVINQHNRTPSNLYARKKAWSF